MMAMPTISATWEVEIRGLRFKDGPCKSMKSYQKNKTKSKMTGDIAQVVKNVRP
jgi:hypothetical protein